MTDCKVVGAVVVLYSVQVSKGSGVHCTLCTACQLVYGCGVKGECSV